MSGLPASKDCRDVLDRQSRQIEAVFDRRGSDMGQHRDVGALEQSWLDGRFVFMDVEPGAEDSFLRQRIRQRRLVDDRPTAHVHEQFGCGS